MAGRTPPEAVKNFARPIQDALTCFADGRVSANSYDPDVEGVLQFNGAEFVTLQGDARVSLSISMRYRISNVGEPTIPGKPWKVSTTGWVYGLRDGAGDALVEYHWHPQITPDIAFPHLHHPLDPERRHNPTGRVLIEDVLTLAAELGAEPRSPEKWEEVRSRNVQNFGKGATWGGPLP